MKINLSQNVCYDRHLRYQINPFHYGKHTMCIDTLQEHYNHRVEIGYGISELFERVNLFLEYKNYKLVCAPNSWQGAVKYSYEKGCAYYIANPNGNDGTYLNQSKIYELANQYEFLIVDEAYGDFNHTSIIDDIPDNTIVLKTLSKSLAMPGARLGWVMGNKECLDFLQDYRPRTAVVGGMESQLQGMLNEIPNHVERMLNTRNYIEKNFETIASAGNYVLFVNPPKHLFNYYAMKQQKHTWRMALTNLDHFQDAHFSSEH